jgi:hypothetical protein
MIKNTCYILLALAVSLLASLPLRAQKVRQQTDAATQLRTFLDAMNARNALSVDSFYVDVERLEQRVAEPSASLADRAILHTLLGHIYRQSSWRENFSLRAYSHYLSALDSLEWLQRVDDAQYAPLLQQGAASDCFRHDLAHFIAQQVTEGLEALTHEWQIGFEAMTEQRLLADRLQRMYEEAGRTDALMELEVQRVLRQVDTLVGEDRRPEAVDLLRHTCRRYPRYANLNTLKNRERELLAPWLSVTADETAWPGGEMKWRVSSRNARQFAARTYRLTAPADSLQAHRNEQNWLARHATLLHETTYTLASPEANTLIARDTTYTIKAPATPDFYLLEMRMEGKTASRQLLRVSSLSLLATPLPDGSLEMQVVEARTGHPVAGATVLACERKRNQYVHPLSYQTDGEGRCLVPAQVSQTYFKAMTTADKASLYQYVSRAKNGLQTVAEKPQLRLHLYTDRALYRPGQTVQVKGILSRQLGDSVAAVADARPTLVLCDVQGKEVARQTVVTNPYGSCTAQFTLPQQGRNGRFTLRADSLTGSCSFRVEEYKRPTFTVDFQPLTQVYAAGDTVTLQGQLTAFSGVKMSHTRVHIQVNSVRSTWWWRSGGIDRQSRQVLTEEVYTDGEGAFRVRVPLDTVAEAGRIRRWQAHYQVQARAISSSGETQEGTTTLRTGSHRLTVEMEEGSGASSLWVKERPQEIRFLARNLQGQPVPARVSLSVASVGGSRAQVFACSVPSDSLFLPGNIYALPSGRYRLTMQATALDGSATSAVEERDITLFSTADRKVPAQDEALFTYLTDTEFTSQSPATLYFGTARDSAFVQLHVMDCGPSGQPSHTLVDRTLWLSDSLVALPLTLTDEDVPSLWVSVAFVKDGLLHKQEYRLTRKAPDKTLRMTWQTFRDRLLPGQQETWRLRVTHPDGTPARAEVLATMYDASLDALGVKQVFDLPLHFPRPYRSWPLQLLTQGGRTYASLHIDPTLLRTPDWQYDCFRPELFRSLGGAVHYGRYLLGSARSMKRMAASAESRMDAGEVFAADAVASMETTATEEEVSEDAEGTGNPAPRSDALFRQNLQETAFFLPQLTTDASGEAALTFTLPECLTTWRVLALAHTTHLAHATLEGTAVAQKALMVQPNVPRFVYVGDRCTLSALIYNLTAEPLEGTATMTLFEADADSRKPYHVQSEPFRAEAGGSATVTFRFSFSEVPLSAPVCRIVAEAGAYSDGEQRYLPVLPLEQKEDLVPEPSHRITPLQSALQSLPALTEPTRKDALSLGAAYYALRMSQALKADSLSQALNTDSQDSLYTERLARLTAQLKALQTEEGGWTWYPGMPVSRTVTVTLVEWMNRLQHFLPGTPEADVQRMQLAARRYLTQELDKEYAALRKEEQRTGHRLTPSEWAIQALYAFAVNDAPLRSEAAQGMVKRLAEVASEAEWPLLEHARLVVILHQYQREKQARALLTTLLDKTVSTPKMGTYFDNAEFRYAWRNRRIPLHVATMEALHTLMPQDTARMARFQLWLLQQKRTTAWDTPLNTVDAVHALLCMGSRQTLLDFDADFAARGALWDADGSLTVARQWPDGVRKTTTTEVRVDSVLTVREGDKVVSRLVVTADRDMDFVELENPRPACAEPAEALSGYHSEGRVGYYRSVTDTAVRLFLYHLPKGTHTFDTLLYTERAGSYHLPPARIQCSYAPEFKGYSAVSSTTWLVAPL